MKWVCFGSCARTRGGALFHQSNEQITHWPARVEKIITYVFALLQDKLMTLHYGVLPNKNYFLQDADDMDDDYEDAVEASDEDYCWTDPCPAENCQLLLYETYSRALPPVSLRFVFVYIRVYRCILYPVLFVHETICEWRLGSESWSLTKKIVSSCCEQNSCVTVDLSRKLIWCILWIVRRWFFVN